ncbi:hypothetical protein J4Q44_G00317040 [Coregonus suidteri]|uniref:Uncharacterized protein n=1 Tax=Coregonus suidteri TaxID=861788 RepID=A0AAN8L0G6_9TELE
MKFGLHVSPLTLNQTMSTCLDRMNQTPTTRSKVIVSRALLKHQKMKMILGVISHSQSICLLSHSFPFLRQSLLFLSLAVCLDNALLLPSLGHGLHRTLSPL